MANVGIIGLGIMGSAYASNLIAAVYRWRALTRLSAGRNLPNAFRA